MKNYDELITKALETLKENDELFCYCIEELDAWNGFADGFRCYDMSELDELFGSMPLSKFLDIITNDFNARDNYMVDTIYGLSSTDYREDIYRENVDEGELLDNLMEQYDNIDISWMDEDFDELLKAIITAKEEAQRTA